MNKQNKDISGLCSKIVFWTFLSQMIYTVLKRLAVHIPYGNFIALIISFSYLLYLYFLLITKRVKFSPKFLLAIIVVTLLYLVSFLSGTPFEKIALYFPQTIHCIIILSLVCEINDLKRLYDEFTKNSKYITIVALAIILVDRSIYAYNMHYSYLLSIALFFHITEFFKNKKISDLLFALTALILIVIYGARGPLLCLALFIVLNIVSGSGKKVFKYISSTAILGFLIFSKRIVQYLKSIAKHYSINSRTINLLLEDVTHTSGRDIIASKANELINEHIVTGVGIAGEFKYMNDYPHNIILDLILHWGVVFGSIIIIIISYIIGKALLHSEKESRMLMIIFICYGLFSLFFSDTYISSIGFFILLGLSLNINKTRNVQECQRTD